MYVKLNEVFFFSFAMSLMMTDDTVFSVFFLLTRIPINVLPNQYFVQRLDFKLF